MSDLELGDGTGLDLLRSMGPERSVPAIALTGYGSEEDRKMCLEAGFETHLIKPVETQATRRGDSEYHPKTIGQFIIQRLIAIPRRARDNHMRPDSVNGARSV